MSPIVAVLPGDGIGPEVTAAAVSVLKECLSVEVREGLVGGAAIAATGDPLPPATLELCAEADAVLLGAVGDARWQGRERPEQGLLRLRRGLDVFANLRPARYMGLWTPLRENLVRNADVLVVRELSGGVYFGEPRSVGDDEAVNTWRQTSEEVRRVAHVAFRQARRRRRRVTSVDKANVLESSRLWRRVVSDVAGEYPDVELEHRYVDAAAFELLADPGRFDVVLTENLFGDILSDELAALAGSIGLLPSASLGTGTPLFEPVHGAAPDIAGQGVANPVGALLSVALLLEHGLNRPELARAVETSVVEALKQARTPDVGGSASTQEFAAVVQQHLGWASRVHAAGVEDDEHGTAWAV